MAERNVGNAGKSRQIILAFMTYFSSIGPGMVLGYSAVAVPTLRTRLNETQLATFASITSLAALIGCIVTEPLAFKYGKRFITFSINLTCFVGCLTIYAACWMETGQFFVLFTGRIISGFAMGLASSHATVYMKEVTSPELSKTFTTWGPIFYSLGITIVYTLGMFLKEDWALIALITCFFPVLGLFFLIFMPEFEFQPPNRVLEQAPLIQAHNVEANTVSEIKRFGLVLLYFSFQQVSGVMVILFYALDVVKIAGGTQDPYLVICMIGLTRFLTAILVSCIGNRCGRRTLLILSGIGMTACMLALASFKIMLDQDISTWLQNNTRYVSLILLLLYFFASSLGFLPLPFALVTEIFPTNTQGIARGALTGYGYLINFILVMCYQKMVDNMGGSGLFFFYGFMALLGTVFVYRLHEAQYKNIENFGESVETTKL